MKNIPHLEDIAFLQTTDEIVEIAAALVMNVGAAEHSVGSISIKYDGTAMVFGNQDGFFISDNGYFNKVPRRWRSVEEIHEANMDDSKTRKFLNAFAILSQRKYRPEMVYYADWLFDINTLQQDGRTFQPNIIEYKCKYDLRDLYRLGLAVHTQAYCGVENTARFIPAALETAPILFPPTEIKIYNELRNYKRLYRLLTDITHSNAQLDKATIQLLRKSLNSIVRRFDYYDRRHLETFIQKDYDFLAYNLDILIRLKYMLLMRLNVIAKEYTIFEMRIGGEPTPHEGFVFRFKDHKVKLVDRFKFSKMNFDQNTKRGWGLDGIRSITPSSE